MGAVVDDSEVSATVKSQEMSIRASPLLWRRRIKNEATSLPIWVRRRKTFARVNAAVPGSGRLSRVKCWDESL